MGMVGADWTDKEKTYAQLGMNKWVWTGAAACGFFDIFVTNLCQIMYHHLLQLFTAKMSALLIYIFIFERENFSSSISQREREREKFD